MKKTLIVLSLALNLLGEDSLSSMPLPQEIFIDFSDNTINETYQVKKPKPKQVEKKMENQSGFLDIFSMFEDNSGFVENASPSTSFVNDNTPKNLNLAVIIPEGRIGNYSKTVVNSLIAYLLTKNDDFNIEVFNTKDETPTSLGVALANIRKKEYKAIIAPLTPMGADFIVNTVNDLLVFIPTINKHLYSSAPQNIIFGGIDYQEQINALGKYSSKKVATFSDGSSLGTRLNEMVSINNMITYSKDIKGSKVNFKYILKNNKRLNNISIFLNMSLVKSSLLASGLRVYDIQPYSLLSTQTNYNPMLLTLTQYEDRKKLYIANSISPSPLKISAINSLFGHSIVYDWVNYSTNVGMDYLYVNYFNKADQREFTQPVELNQIIYDVKIEKPTGYGFSDN